MNALVQGMQGMRSFRAVTLAVVGIVLLTVFAFLSVRLTSPVMAPLYTNLTTEDSSTIVTELGAMGVEFNLAQSGSQILVKSSEVLKVRMALAQKGLPSQGSIVGYEVFDRDNSMGASRFVMDVNLLRALEGELGRTISAVESIKSSRVHLVIPKRSVFEQSMNLEPSASVLITLNNRARVPKNEIVAVKHLVSSAVPGLSPSQVTVINSNGEVLAKAQSDEESESAAVSASTAEEYRTNFENRLKRTIELLLEQAVGFGKVQAEVSADIAFDRVHTTAETYDPDGAVPRSIRLQEEIFESSDGNDAVVGVSGNLPENSAGQGAAGQKESQSSLDEVTNFEISKTITNKASEVGTVRKLSVAVLVDGTYSNDEEGNRIYAARSDEELEQLRALVRSAMGFDAERGDHLELVNMPFPRDTDHLFPEEGPLDWLKQDLDSILKTLVIGAVAILFILIVIRPLIGRALDMSISEIEEASGGGPDALAANDIFEQDDGDMDLIQDRMEGAPSRRVNQLIENNPDETLALIRSWLAQKT